MNFLKIFQSEKKCNDESVSPPNGEVPKENGTSSPPVTKDVELNYSHDVNTQEGCNNVSAPFENCEEANMGGHVDGSVRQANFENGASGLMTQDADPGVHLTQGASGVGETGPTASSSHPVGSHSVGSHSAGVHPVGIPPVDMPPPQFGGPGIYEQKENYDYANGSLNAGMPYPCSTYDMSANDTYAGGSHGRTHGSSSANSSSVNGITANHSTANQGGVRNEDYLIPAEKSITSVAKRNFCVNSTGGEETLQPPTDLHANSGKVNDAKVNLAPFESKPGGIYMDPKSNYAEQVERGDSYNKHHIVVTPYTDSASVGTLPYGYDHHVSSNNAAANGAVSTPGGMNKTVDYAFPSGSFPPSQVVENNLSSNLVHSFQHQLNDIAFTQQNHVAVRKKGEFPSKQSYMNLHSGVGGADKMEGTNAGSNYNYEEDRVAKRSSGVQSGVHVGTTQQRESARKLVQGGHVVNSAQMSGQQMSGQQMSGQQMSGQQMSGQQMSGQQMNGQQMSSQQMNGQQVGSPQMEDPPNGAPSGQLRMGKAEQKRKQRVGDPRRGVGGGEEGHSKGSYAVGKMVRWKQNEEEDHLKEKKVDAPIEREDDKGNEYYYEKTLDFLKKEFSIHHSDNRNSYLNDRDMLAKTPFFKLVNFEKKLATERKRVLNYYHEDRKQIYSTTINKDKQFSHIFFNNEKYYDAKEILAYLLPYHTFYLDDICIDSSDDDEEFCENLKNDVREIDAGISQVKDSFRAYTNPSMVSTQSDEVGKTAH
ncbi:hypothetical protein PCYB_084310 [Plasmodium cynomolgi strain B]|uniref:Uncharacterized protein n=1 Tax=Plasmodium cynomolgi (strain B) TaxID=1120755 RepID=K6UVF1_PLACD|nr:hypothetical protein PCYB_084310 [Plasmodium cynomolgi strain B]GAB66270.1 hypothetical protein PCYB_084310 [Plasmodium cynomolgi strain B]